jgi:hypothetical protein
MVTVVEPVTKFVPVIVNNSPPDTLPYRCERVEIVGVAVLEYVTELRSTEVLPIVIFGTHEV